MIGRGCDRSPCTRRRRPSSRRGSKPSARGRPSCCTRTGRDGSRSSSSGLLGGAGSSAAAPGTDVSLDWELKDISGDPRRASSGFGQAWTVADDGLSRNGTYVDGDRDPRPAPPRRARPAPLRRHDAWSFPRALPREHGPPAPRRPRSAPRAGAWRSHQAQRRVLVCAGPPVPGPEGAFASPATNREIAEELYLNRRIGQDAPAGAERQVRHPGPAAEPQASARLVELALQPGRNLPSGPRAARWIIEGHATGRSGRRVTGSRASSATAGWASSTRRRSSRSTAPSR